MIRFIAVEKPAAQEIISNRTFQSTEFEAGQALAQLLLSPQLRPLLGPHLDVQVHGDGLFMLSTIEMSKDYVLFDMETADLFTGHRTPAEVLLFLQKVLRFAVKHWSGLPASSTERFIPNSSKVIIFPFPFSLKMYFRISIELTPDAERQARRPSDGRCILVYKSGTAEGEGAREKVSTTNFRRFLEARRDLPRRSTVQGDDQPTKISSLLVTSLQHPIKQQVFPTGGFDKWLTMLTGKQKEFVLSALTAPHRIEGPAGTGKTLSLVLKAIATLRQAENVKVEHRALFITHSEATRRTVEQLFTANDPSNFIELKPLSSSQTLKLSTLHQLCGELLGREISETELIDRDALESKQLQVVYVNEALRSALAEDLPTHRRFMSPGFVTFLATTEMWALSEMFQHEISVVIKGRAEEEFDHYKKLPRLQYGLPIESQSDRGFVWRVFTRYQDQLKISAQFDTDDVVLTTIGQLDTPIWRRRRGKDGYDSIFIDETHLFNVNELSLFHYLTKTTKDFPIAHSIDRSQAIGDRDWSDELFNEALTALKEDGAAVERTRVESVFRCSPEIVDLAFSVTSAGATLFTNFDDPLKIASSMFTLQEERKCARPRLIECSKDEEMIELAFSRADKMTKEMDVSKGEIAIIAFNEELFGALTECASRHNKPIELLKQRGDIEVVQRAEKSGRFILSLPEFVGGLEFAGVVLVGVDEGRVPPAKSTSSIDSSNFLTYAAHNKLYVAITRARFRVEILGSKERGVSPLLSNAIGTGILERGLA
jgi:superfamily I DNA/RNA helicase